MTTTIKTTTSARPARRHRSRHRARSNRYTRTTFSVEPRDQSARTATLRFATYIEYDAHKNTTVSTHSATLHLTSSSSTPAYLCPAYVSHDRIDPRRGCRVPWSRATFGCARRRRRWTWRKSRRWFGQSSSSGDVDRRACMSSVDDGRRGGRRWMRGEGGDATRVCVTACVGDGWMDGPGSD